MLGAILLILFQESGFDLQGWVASNFEGLNMLVLLGVVPAALGIPIGKWMERRLR